MNSGGLLSGARLQACRGLSRGPATCTPVTTVTTVTAITAVCPCPARDSEAWRPRPRSRWRGPRRGGPGRRDRQIRLTTRGRRCGTIPVCSAMMILGLQVPSQGHDDPSRGRSLRRYPGLRRSLGSGGQSPCWSRPPCPSTGCTCQAKCNPSVMPVPGLRPLVTVAKLLSASSVPDYCAVGGPLPNYAARSP